MENNAFDREWELMRDIFAPLRGKVPFYCVAGNHDLGTGISDHNTVIHGYEPYKKYSLCDIKSEEQVYENGECWYQLYEREGFLLVGIGNKYGLEDDLKRLAWVNEVLERYADYPAGILTHAFLYNNGEPNETSGLYLLKHVIDGHPNVRLLLCGHHKGVQRWEKTYPDGRVFRALMYNLQNEKNAAGYCQLLTFDPVSRTLYATSYSPYLDDYNFYDKEYDSVKVQKEKDGNYEFISFIELSSVWRSLSAIARKAKEERENEILSIKKRIEEQNEEMYWRTYGYSHKEFNGVYSDVFVVCPSVNFTNDIKQKVEINDSSDVPAPYKIKYINEI